MAYMHDVGMHDVLLSHGYISPLYTVDTHTWRKRPGEQNLKPIKCSSCNVSKCVEESSANKEDWKVRADYFLLSLWRVAIIIRTAGSALTAAHDEILQAAGKPDQDRWTNAGRPCGARDVARFGRVEPRARGVAAPGKG